MNLLRSDTCYTYKKTNIKSLNKHQMLDKEYIFYLIKGKNLAHLYLYFAT